MELEKQTSITNAAQEDTTEDFSTAGNGVKIFGEGTITDTKGKEEKEGRLQDLFKKNFLTVR